MTIVADKYRGTTTYNRVYCELITAARYHGTVTYQRIAQLMGLPIVGAHMGKQVGHILGEISEDEHLQGRPMLSAVAVGVSRKPGDGFYLLARDLNKLKDDSAKARELFWESEKTAIYEEWQDTFHN